MKTLTLAFFTLLSSSAWAAGSFACRAETYSGKKITVNACLSHGIAGLCSDLQVSIEGRYFDLPLAQVSSFYVGKLKHTQLLALKAYDSNMENEVVDLVFEYDPKSDSVHEDYTQGEYARLILRHEGLTYRFADLRCFVEQAY